MAIKDVRQYYYNMLGQYLEEKQNLADFEEALKNGLITEDQMQEAMTTVEDLEKNYHRLAYIMYLLDMPNRKDKKEGYVKQHKQILDELKKLGADIDSIKEENTDALVHFKAALKALNKKDEQ
jgi:benzoyl-CoA reductase/2-hydroxyglutaryl-CoA dehydratase subunit BcrC/BadD/HgdB